MRVFHRAAAGRAMLAIALGLLVFAGGPAFAQEGQPEPPAAAEADHAEDGHAGNTHAASGDPNPMAVDPDLAIWTLVVFVLLFTVLRLFAWPQIKEALEERERRIANTIAAAEALQEQAKQLLAEHDAKLGMAAAEVRELLEEARRDAEHTKSRIVAEARQAADEERQRSLREIGRAKDGAIQELAVSSANIAVDLARRVLRSELSPDKQAGLVRDALGRLASTNPSDN